MTTVSAKYADMVSRVKDAQSDQIIRPIAGSYNLVFRGVTIEDGEFAWTNPSKGELPALIVQAQWTLENNPATDTPLDFPGRRWTIPLASASELAAIPANQQKRSEIQDSQFKGFLEGILGYDPQENLIEALEGVNEHSSEAAKTEEPMRFNVRIRYQKKNPDQFDRETINRSI